jgi:molybdenum cofactor synthesis domain-containing protein
MTGRLRATVITVSDEVASGKDSDRGGPVASELLTELGLDVVGQVVSDDEAQLEGALQDAIASGARFVMTCGGTGIGPRDLTSDVIARHLAFEIPGIAEEIRRRGKEHTAQALVSREIAGVITPDTGPRVLVLCAPGSRGGVRDAIGVVGPMLNHIVEELDGKGHA